MVAHGTYSFVCGECQCTTLVHVVLRNLTTCSVCVDCQCTTLVHVVLRNLTRCFMGIHTEHGKFYDNYSHCGITPSSYRGIQLVEWFDVVVVVLVTRVSK